MNEPVVLVGPSGRAMPRLKPLGSSWVVGKHALAVARPTLELCLHAADPPFALRLEQLRDAIATLVTRAEIPEYGLARGRWWLLFVHITTVEPPSRDCIARNCYGGK